MVNLDLFVASTLDPDCSVAALKTKLGLVERRGDAAELRNALSELLWQECQAWPEHDARHQRALRKLYVVEQWYQRFA